LERLDITGSNICDQLTNAVDKLKSNVAQLQDNNTQLEAKLSALVNVNSQLAVLDSRE